MQNSLQMISARVLALPHQIRRLPLTVIACLLAVYVIWGSTYFAIRVALVSLPPFLLIGTRFLAAGGILFVFLRWRGAPLPTRKQWLNSAIVGALLLGGGNGGVTVAEQWVASSLAAAIVATAPLWVAIFSGLLGHWPSRLEWVGILIGLAGVLVLNLEGDLRASPLGAVFLALAPICWAIGSILSRRVNLPQGAMGTAAEMLMGGLLLMVISVVGGERLTAMPSLAAIGAWAYLVVFGSIVAFSAYMYLIRTVRPALALSYTYVNPIVALLLGVVLAGEHISLLGLGAIAVMLAGVVFISVARGRTPRA